MSEIINNCLTYSAKEVASLLGISQAKIYDLIRNNEIPNIKLGNRYVVPIRAFNEWFNTAPVGGDSR